MIRNRETPDAAPWLDDDYDAYSQQVGGGHAGMPDLGPIPWGDALRCACAWVIFTSIGVAGVLAVAIALRVLFGEAVNR